MMILNILGVIAGLFFILFVVIAVVLIVQSKTTILPYERWFSVRHPDRVTASQDGVGGYVIRWEDQAPEAVYVGTAPQPEICTQVVETTLLDDHALYFTGLEPSVSGRHFFKLLFPGGRQEVIGERVLLFEKAVNFRDIGGYRTHNGQQVAWGRFFRSTHLGRLNDADRDRLTRMGLRTVCDLREDDEVDRNPDALPPGVTSHRTPIASTDPAGALRVIFARRTLAHYFPNLYYRYWLVDRSAAQFGKALRLLCDPTNLPLLVHCTAGKDRAGITTALTLLALGVPEETVVADYTLSNLYAPYHLRRVIKAYGYRGAPRMGFRIEQFYPMLSTAAGNMEIVIAHIKKQYGTVQGYLTGPAGLTTGDLVQLRANLLV
jgi:protein-tyrosine phosphatase